MAAVDRISNLEEFVASYERTLASLRFIANDLKHTASSPVRTEMLATNETMMRQAESCLARCLTALEHERKQAT